MYICVCNALNCRAVNRVIADGEAGTVSEVYKSLGTTPVCGKCSSMIRDMLRAGGPETAAAT